MMSGLDNTKSQMIKRKKYLIFDYKYHFFTNSSG